jgi:hypothetical protein
MCVFVACIVIESKECVGGPCRTDHRTGLYP